MALETMDVDTFFREGFEESESEEGDTTSEVTSKPLHKKKMNLLREKKKVLKEKKVPKTANKRSSPSKHDENNQDKDSGNSHTADPDVKMTGKSKVSDVKQHKAVLSSLASSDPEFYKFLQEEDKNLLNFDVSSGEEEEEVEDVHRLPKSLVEKQDKPKKRKYQTAESSDEDSSDDDSSSDDTADDEDNESDSGDEKAEKAATSGQPVFVTVKMAEKWHKLLITKPNVVVAEKAIKAFEAAVADSAEETDEVRIYKVDGITNFNAVVRTCLRCFPYVFYKLMDAKPTKSSDLPSSSKKWGQVKPLIRTYLSALSVFLKNLASPDVLNAVLKHIAQLINFVACFPKQTRIYMRRLINIWSAGEETSRVLAFLSIMRLLRLKKEDLMEKTIKEMYMAYIRNCKFTSVTLLPLIGFMQHSLVEIFSLDLLLGYQYTFVYIRQLAIHLRNAMVSKKKDCFQAVYNWQYIHSCMFFSRLLGATNSDENLKQLVYPLVQIIIGVIRLVPTAKFYPLRFHCVRMLNLLSQKTGTFIPSLSLLLEVIETTDFQKKTSRYNTRQIDFSCILKLSKAQTQDRAFKDGVMDQLYELIFDHLACYSHTIGFSEMTTPAITQMKHFVKTCKIANFTKMFKQIVNKMEENSKVMDKRLKSVTIDLADAKAVAQWEAASKAQGTPIATYYKKYRAMRDHEIQLEVTGKERMEHMDNTPIIPTGQRKATEDERKEFSKLFDDEGEANSDSDNEQRFSLEKPKSAKAKNRKKGKEMEDVDDNVDDDDDVDSLNSEEFELLAKSAEADYDDEDSNDDIEVESDSEGEDNSNIEEDSEPEDNVDAKEDIVEDLELSDLD